MPRRAKASTPPTPASDIFANARNNVITPGGGVLAGAGRSGTGAAAGGDSRDISGSKSPVGHRPRQFGVFPRDFQCFWSRMRPWQPLSFQRFARYIGGAGSPAMEINRRRNKPFGPGGGTRRLHQSPTVRFGLWRGRNRIDEGVK